jgi:hypothetical protein
MYYWTRDVVVDPSDPDQNTWYVCVYSGWGGAPNGLGGLYRTTDRGMHWIKLTGSQFDRVASITFNPKKPEQAYLTTETQGLWISDDMNNSQPAWTLVDSYPFRQPERVFFNPYKQDEIWVTSFGNGLRLADLSSNGIKEEPATLGSVLKIFPIPSNGCFTISLESSLKNAEFFLTDITGRTVYNRNLNPGVDSCTIDAENLINGLYNWILVDQGKLLDHGKLQIQH